MEMISFNSNFSGMDGMLEGGGEMGQLMRECDWASTPLGPVEKWPQSLRTAVSICMASQFPMLIWWGPDLVKIYNDAYRPILLQKHPKALGQRGRECWPEIWDIIGPMLEGVLTRGEATWSENQLLPLERNGFAEECYFTFSYSPIRDESGGIGGVFTAVTETTRQVLGERRLRILGELATQTAEAHALSEVCRVAAQTLSGNPADLPFVLLYLLTPDGKQARLAGSAGLPASVTGSFKWIDLNDESAAWPFAEVVENNSPVLIDDLTTRNQDIAGYFSTLGASPPHAALVLPVTGASQERLYGFMVAGISPFRPLDEEYQGYLTLVSGQIAASCDAARAYQDAQERAAALAEIDRAKTVFFSNVSHEFRTPLTLSLGPLEAVLADTEHTLSGEQRQQLEMVRRNQLRQLKLVNTLLDFSRIEAGRMQATYAPTDLASLTADLASAFRSTIEHAGLQLIVDCPPLAEPVYIDRDMWEKIILNLLSNAFKFTFEGSIRVALQMVGDEIELRVEDTGVGIRADDLTHLFERFYRAHQVRSRAYEGSGIGLALVQELTRLQGGSISVESVEGKGSVFIVRLPRGNAHLPGERLSDMPALSSTALGADPYVEEAMRWLPETPERVEAISLLERREPSPFQSQALADSTLDLLTAPPGHLLIVDDNADMRDYLKRILSPFYRLTLASNGSQALELARAVQPDLVVSDVMMPEMDGFTLLTELRGDPSTSALPIILLSARAGEEATLTGIKAGADDYLVKPFSARELLARVQARLEIARLRQDLEQRKDAFIGMASHELRTPITSIKGNLQLAERRLKLLSMHPDELSGDANRLVGELSVLLARALRQIGVQVRLINDLLDVSRLQTNKLELSPSLCDLVGIVREAVVDQRTTTPTRSILFEQEDAGPVFVMADADRVGQVVSNYLTNALKFSPSSEPVVVGLTIEGSDARVWVRDRGAGLSAEQQQQVWERFYQVPGLTVRSGSSQGLGLGLFICQTLISLQGGQVGVESVEGQGSTFWFTLPLAEPEALPAGE